MTKRIAFSGLIACDAIFVVEGFPIEDSGTTCKHFIWNSGGHCSNNSIVFSKLRTWYNNKVKESPEIEIEILGTLSEDFPSKFLREIFQREQVRYDRCFIDGTLETPVAGTIINSLNGSRTFTSHTKHYPDLTLEQYVQYDLMNFDWIHVESRNNIRGLIDMVRYVRSHQEPGARRSTISIEVERNREGVTQVFNEQVDYFFIERDFGSARGWKDLKETIQETCKLIAHEAYVIFVWGEQGSKIAKVSKGKIIGSIGSTQIFPPKDGVIDSCGAGDTYMSATVFDILIRGSKPEDAITFGSKVAGAKVGMQGYQDLYNWESYI